MAWGVHRYGRWQQAVHGSGERCDWQWQGCCRTVLEPPWHQAWRRFVEWATAWATAAMAAFMWYALACRMAWQQRAATLNTAGRLEHPTRPIKGGVGCFERKWRAAAARRQRQPLDERGSAVIYIADDALGGFPDGYDDVGGLR